MINSLHVKNFKCLDQIDLNLSKITLLAGLNGMGKSTCIQSLLLLQQSAVDQSDPLCQLMRNGYFVSLGNPKDILWEGASSELIEFGISTTETSWKGSFLLDEKIQEFVALPSNSKLLPKGIGLFSNHVQYLRAERWGPRTSFPTSNSEVRINHRLGKDGEFAVHFLTEFAEHPVTNDALLHPEATSKQLIHQVEAWLGEISPGSRIFTTGHNTLDLVSIEYAFLTKRGETNHYRATNVGFGISYVLPILLAALASPAGTLLLIENPESHLHPRGQRKIGELLALTSQGGVQVVVETHSDHVLNGLRLAVHDGVVSPESVAIHFFERESVDEAIRAKVTTPQIDKAGRIDFWPDGFFDESQKTLRKLLVPPGVK